MQPFTRDHLKDFDIGDPELNARYDEVLAHMHEAGCPVARSEVGEGYWLLNKYEDVARASKEWETFSASDGFMVNRPEGLPFFAPGEADPPLQAPLRKALEPFLRPKATQARLGAVRAHADRIIDGFIDKGEVDFVEAFANPLPQVVFSVEVAGMDAADMPYLLKVFSLSGPMEERGANFALGMAKIGEYLEQRRNEPARGDIIDALLAFEHEDYADADRIGTLSQLTIGGIGTTGYAFSGGFHHLATHPEDRELLVNEPNRIPKAIDEFLRLYLGAPLMGRRVMKDTEIGGVNMAAGDRVLLGFGPASRDPAVCPVNPNGVDITRQGSRHMAFGSGTHRCVGMHLARVILKVGYERMLERIPEFSVPEGFEPEYETGNVRHMVSLPLQWDPAKTVSSTEKEVSA